MRIYDNCYELMSETGRNLWEMGAENRPLSYQNKDISDNPDYLTKELIAEQYCLTRLDNPEALFVYSESKEWADAELLERCNPKLVNPGEAWKIRPDIWKQFLNENGKFDYTYNGRLNYGSKLYLVLEELARNPDTRQAVVLIYHHTDVYSIGGKKRVPCTMYYNFLVRKNRQGERVVNIIYHQRSSDFVTHFGNDVYLAYKLMEYVAEKLGYKPGYLYHTIDSLHVYQKDWLQLKTSVGDML